MKQTINDIRIFSQDKNIRFTCKNNIMSCGNIRRMAKARPWFKDRIKEVGKKQIQLAHLLGVESPRVYEISGGIREVQSHEITIVAQFLELSERDLLQSLKENRLVTTTDNDVVPTVSGVSMIPVYGNVQAGAFIEAFEEDPIASIPIISGHAGQGLFGLKVIGDSMDIIYPEGTYLVCQRLFDYPKELKDGLRVIVKRRAAGDLFEATVKQYSKAGDVTTLTPLSSNPKYKQLTIVNGGDHHHDTGSPDVEVWAIVIWAVSPQG